MTLPSPNLDSRRFKDLVEEARARIPRYTPEWTNFNPSDPGMTLVQLHAWLTETILYELNRVPERNYIKFLDLLGIVPEPARPALTELSFKLDKLDKPDDPLVVTIPRLTKVAVDDPDLPSEVVFETDRTQRGLNIAIGALIVPNTDTTASTRELVSAYEKDTITFPHAFETLGDKAGRALYLGLLLRPLRAKEPDDYAEDKFPSGAVDLYVDAVRVKDKGPGENGAVIEGPIGTLCPPPGSAGEPLDHLEWHIYTGPADVNDEAKLFEDDSSETHWTRLNLSGDGTRGLSGSGHLVFEVPETATALDPLRLSQAFWESFGAVRPPQRKEDLEGQLKSGSLDNPEDLADFWEKMGATLEQVDELAACGENAAAIADKISATDYKLDPSALTLTDWIAVNERYRVALPQTKESYRPLYWIRGRLFSLPIDAELPAAIRGLHLNTVPATQASTRLDDRLGRSTGRPAQVFTLPKTPVLIAPDTGKPDLDLEIAEEGQAPGWTRVDDFFRSGPSDPHYVLDPETGRITLGDGRHGRVPIAGAQVTAVRYRVGGGGIGNVGAGLVTKIRGRIRGVAGATNLRPAHDGSDAEPLDEVQRRAPHELRHRDRAVSAGDFADLALRTPGVALHKAFALARRAVDADNKLVEKDGAVTLLVLPVNDHLQPQPDEDQKRAICRWLEPRRLITTELHITGPSYDVITALKARLTIRQDADLAAVTESVYDALLNFLSPFTGGEDGTGWPFGQDIYYGDLYERILAVEGVRQASRLRVDIGGVPGNAATDIALIAEGRLPSLSRQVIDMEVGFA